MTDEEIFGRRDESDSQIFGEEADDNIFGEDAIEKKIRQIRGDVELFGGSAADVDAIERELRSTLQAYKSGMLTRSERNEKLGVLLDAVSNLT